MLNLRWIFLVILALSLTFSLSEAAAVQPVRANHCLSVVLAQPDEMLAQDCKACSAEFNHCSACISALPVMPLKSIVFSANAIQIAAPLAIFQSLNSPPLLPPPVHRA